MDKKVAALLGTVAGAALMGSAQAATAPTAPAQAQPSSYADLLAPIANPVEALKADLAAPSQQPTTKLAQGYYYGYPYYYRYYHHHHHHHHHHHRHHTWFGGPGFGVYIR